MPKQLNTDRHKILPLFLLSRGVMPSGSQQRPLTPLLP